MKRVLVTGATSGIGAAVAERFAAQSAELILLGRDARKLRAMARALSTRTQVRTCVLDLSRRERVAREMVKMARDLPSLDAVIHAAGAFVGGSVLSQDLRSLDALLAVNVGAAISITRALLRPLEAARGSIIFINSSGVLRPQRLSSLYIATKHALKGVADALREELNPRGIRVTSVFPGRTATPMQRSVHQLEGRRYVPKTLLQPADVAELIACAVNLPETAELVDAHIRPRRAPPPASSR